MPLVFAYAISAGMWEMWASAICQIWAITPVGPYSSRHRTLWVPNNRNRVSPNPPPENSEASPPPPRCGRAACNRSRSGVERRGQHSAGIIHFGFAARSRFGRCRAPGAGRGGPFSQNHPILCRSPDGTNLRFPDCVKRHSRGSAVPTAEKYRQHAVDCLRLAAERTMPDDLKRVLFCLAQGWLNLARRLESKTDNTVTPHLISTVGPS